MRSPIVTGREPWREVSQPDLSAQRIHQSVLEAVKCFPASVWQRVDAAILVLRGGALLESAVATRVPLVRGVTASRQGGGAVIKAETAGIDTNLRKLLICDVLADTGGTLLACGHWARQLAPLSEIHIACIYATASARERIEREYSLHCIATFGQTDWHAQEPAAIPYDFGDVARDCGLV